MLSDIIYRGRTFMIAVGITMLVLLLSGCVDRAPITIKANGAPITVNANGGGDYTSIQDAINNSNNRDTILVYSGTYFENVNVTKQLILKGVDSGGKPVVNANRSGSAITLSAGNTTLEGFTVVNSGGWYTTAGIYVVSNNNLLKDNKASNNDAGIFLSGSSNNTLSGNTASNNNNEGIYLSISSNNNTLSNNIASNNIYGIFLYSSSNNTLNNNNATNDGTGILVSASNNNTLSNNNASNNSVEGIVLLDSNENILNNNIANSNNEYGISVSASNSNILNGNTVNSNSWGISLSWSSKNNIISGNTVDSNQGRGISMDNGDSNNNTLSGNNVSNNRYGIYLDNINSNNTIYNNFFNNINNFAIYDSVSSWSISKTKSTNIIGGPYLGGNYWANPNGTGFSQTCVDRDTDGICDSPYILDSNNVDYLPFAPNP